MVLTVKPMKISERHLTWPLCSCSVKACLPFELLTVARIPSDFDVRNSRSIINVLPTANFSSGKKMHNIINTVFQL